MHPEIYINRALSYLKYAYSLQYEAVESNNAVKYR